MKAWRDEYGITSVLCQIWSRARRGLFAVALLQARGTTIAKSPPLPRPTQSRARPADCYGQSRGGKNNIFPQTRGLTLPQAGTGQILELKFGAALTTLAGLSVSSHLLPHGGSGNAAQPCKSHGIGIHEAAPTTAGTPWSCCCPLESVPLCVTRSVGLRDSQGQDHHHPAMESAEHPDSSAPDTTSGLGPCHASVSPPIMMLLHWALTSQRNHNE